MRVMAALSAVVVAVAVTGAVYVYAHRYAIAGVRQVTLTAPQALAKDDRILIQTVNSVSPALTWWISTPSTQGNLSGWTGKPDGTATVDDTGNVMTRVAEAKKCVLLGMFATSLAREGYSVSNPSTVCSMHAVYGTASDGTTVSITTKPVPTSTTAFEKIEVMVGTGNIAFSADDWYGYNWPANVQPSPPTASTGGLEVAPKDESTVPTVDDPYWSH